MTDTESRTLQCPECDFKMVTESGRVLLIEHGRTHRLRSEARATRGLDQGFVQEARNHRNLLETFVRACEERPPESAVAHILRFSRAAIEDIDGLLTSRGIESAARATAPAGLREALIELLDAARAFRGNKPYRESDPTEQPLLNALGKAHRALAADLEPDHD